jgi:mRNA-degrading endonuclease RelE of RelBE toxin-antitoxin system
MCEVCLTKRFDKQFRKLDRQIQRAILEELEILKDEPEYGDSLKGVLRDFRKLKIRNFRVVYRLKGSNTIAEVFFVDHREHIYKELERLRRGEAI